MSEHRFLTYLTKSPRIGLRFQCEPLHRRSLTHLSPGRGQSSSAELNPTNAAKPTPASGTEPSTPEPPRRSARTASHPPSQQPEPPRPSTAPPAPCPPAAAPAS